MISSVSVSIGDQSALLAVLLRSVGRLGVVEEALAGLFDGDIVVHVEEDVVVPVGSVVEGTLVVIEGTLRIEGEVDPAVRGP